MLKDKVFGIELFRNDMNCYKINHWLAVLMDNVAEITTKPRAYSAVTIALDDEVKQQT